MSQFKGSSYAEALTELHKVCFSNPWSLENFQQILSLPTTFGLGDHTGFILCSDLGDTLEILTLAVHPDYRRQGVASHLLKSLQDFAHQQGHQKIFLEVNVTNTPAINLYLKNGFKQIGRRKDYYHKQGKSFDALCFAWQKPQQ